MRSLLPFFLVLFLLPALAQADLLQDADTAVARGDYQTAFKLLRPLADQDNAEAQVRIGALYEKGWGVKQDYAEALKWYRKTAEQGDPDGQSMLGVMYERGHGVKQDLVEAFFWCILGEKNGSPEVYEVAEASKHLTPVQIAAVNKRVAEWLMAHPDVGFLQEKAEKGDTIAQGELADMYQHGWNGLKQDWSEAYFWRSLADFTFQKDGETYYTKHLTSEQKAAVNLRVREWIKTHPGPRK